MVLTVVVEGGPLGLGRVQQLDIEMPVDRVVVAYYGRHEHFELTGEKARVEGHDVPVFRWSYSTAIAE
ncbi:DUF5988 family protein [Streptomyces sp. GS7]|uniref:DUF5988 family protein n=1 Tax=Streptomyces sp. GS7 TaxID=2692234 RepID=UPI0013194AD7|nr:DUF5988 family protein [Streptomyces sp. GS7]QHC23458.1 hypothetical protein GR130_20790 [Streptomyces sp. GS7]